MITQMETLSRFRISRKQIKWAVIFMMCLGHSQVLYLSPSNHFRILTWGVGYLANSSTTYFTIDAFKYSKSRGKYVLRLFAFGLIAQLPYNYFITGNTFDFMQLNYMFTLIVCFLIVKSWYSEKSKAVKIFSIAGLFLLSGICDSALVAPFFTVMYLWAYGSKKRMVIATVCNSIFMALIIAFTAQIENVLSTKDIIFSGATALIGPAIAGTCFAFFYDPNKQSRIATSRLEKFFNKWFFYLFYPAHIILFDIIKVLA